MSISRMYAIFVRQIYLIKGKPMRLASMFLWTIMNILMWGFISKYLGTFGGATFGLVTVLLGAIILWDFFGRIQQGVMTAFLEDIWSQNFINFFASPLKISEYLAGLSAISLVLTVFGFVFTVALAGLLFGYNIFKIGILLLPAIVILIVFGLAIGVFVSALMFRLGPSAEWIAWPIPFVLSIFAGVYYPVSTLPVALQWFARLIPASYVFESMRAVLASQSFQENLFKDLSIAMILSLAYLLLGYWYFIKVYQRNLNAGGIARFSAEA